MDASVKQWLKAWSGGDQEALGELTPKVYVELRRMAGKYMQRENPGNTLQATALVHEVFLKLVDANDVDWKDKAHFFAVSANMMRRILVDRARARGAAKHGGGALLLSLDDAPELAASFKDRRGNGEVLKISAQRICSFSVNDVYQNIDSVMQQIAGPVG